MKRNLAALARETFDLLVIGGGILGAGIARDAALRGWRVALVEKDDFGAGTTANSTRLIHGGLRYLELGDFGLVREALQERRLLLQLAPHRVRPLPFLVPIYRGQRWKPLTLRAGLILYDSMAFGWGPSDPGGSGLRRHRALSQQAVLELEPDLRSDGLLGGMLYYDAQVRFPERLNLDNLLDAVAHGAKVVNHAHAVRLLRDGERVTGAVVEDGASPGGTVAVAARLVLNAAGPWADEIIRLAEPEARARVRRTKGVHLVTPSFTRRAVLLLAESNGRAFFVVPWQGYALIGTTDTDFEASPDQAAAGADDVRYLLSETQRAFPSVQLDPIHYAFAGVRALQHREGVAESSVSRRHQLVDHARDGLPGLFSLIGGKITSYRRIAEEVVDALAAQPDSVPAKPCTTAQLPFVTDWPWLQEEVARAAGRAGLDLQPAQLLYLAETYGEAALRVVDRMAQQESLSQPVRSGQPTVWAELAYGIDEEMVCSSADFLLRRTPLGFAPGRARECVQDVAAFIGARLGWDTQRVSHDVTSYLATLDRMSVPQVGAGR